MATATKLRETIIVTAQHAKKGIDSTANTKGGTDGQTILSIEKISFS